MRRLLDKIAANRTVAVTVMALFLAAIPMVYILAPLDGYYADSWVTGGNKDSIYGGDTKEDKIDHDILDGFDKDMTCECFNKFSEEEKKKLKEALKSKKPSALKKLPEKYKETWDSHSAGAYFNPSKHVTGAGDSGRSGIAGMIPDAMDIMGDIAAGFQSSLNEMFYNMYDSIGFTLKNITLGRLDGGGIRTKEGYRISLYTFEMSSGNVYGIAAMAIYNIIRNCIYILLACIILGKYAALLWAGNSTYIVSAAKETVKNLIIMLIMLPLMPYILDLVIYLRDVILYMEISLTTGMFGLDTIDLTAVFKEITEKKNNWITQFMYGGSYWLCIYFAYNYVKTAVAMVLYVIAFPIICVISLFDRQIMGSWLKGMLECLCIPIFDTALLAIPAIIGLIGYSFPIYCIQLMVCMAVIPSRKVFGRLLNLNSVASSGGTGIGLMMGIGRLASAIGGAVGGTLSGASAGMREANASMEKANFHSDMARAEQGIAPQFSSQGSAYEMKKPGTASSGLHGNKEGGMQGMSEDAAILKAGTTENEEAPFQNLDAKNPSHEGRLSEGGDQAEMDADQMDGFDMQFGHADGEDAAVPMDEPSDDGQYAFDSENSFKSQGDGKTKSTIDKDAVNKAKQLVLEKYANKFNVESAAFKNLSNEKRAELYRQRASYQKQQALSNAVGKGALAISGLLMGTVPGMFLGPEATLMSMGLGLGMGGWIGNALEVPPSSQILDFDLEPTDQNGQGPSPAPQSSHTKSKEAPHGEKMQDVNANTKKAKLDFDSYKAEFVRMNTYVISKENLTAFKGFRTNMGGDMDGFLSSAYHKHPDDYEAFRDDVTAQYARDLKKRLMRSTESAGNKALDEKCINHLVKEYSSRYVNPVDGKGKQLDVPSNHLFSKPNLEARGIKYE